MIKFCLIIQHIKNLLAIYSEGVINLMKMTLKHTKDSLSMTNTFFWK